MDHQVDLKSMLANGSRLLREAYRLYGELKELKKLYLPTEGGYKPLWHGIKPVGMKLLIVILWMLLLAPLAVPLEKFVQILFFNFGFSERFSIMIMYIFQIVLLILLLVGVQAFANKKIIQKNQANADRLERNKLYNAKLYQEEQALQARLQKAVGQYMRACGDYIPPDYQINQDAIDFFARAVENGRADSLKEAINLYETELHQRRMEEKQDELIRKQDEANMIAAANFAANAAAAEAQRRQADAMAWQAEELRRMNNSNNRYYY